jgi:hypothetical protein
MASQGGGDGSAPYVGVAQLTATPEPDQIDPAPVAAHAAWVQPLSAYGRRMTSDVHGSRYG